jgi:aminopeptidase N
VYHERNSSANTYAKGAAVLHMLHDILGNELYRRVMKEYITRHAYGNVETNDLKRCIEDVTGLNLHWFFSQWLYKAGYPELHVSSRWDDAGRRLVMHIRQVQHIDSICGFFRFPLTLLAVDARGEETPFRVEIMGPDTLIHLPLAVQPVRTEIDPDNVLCGRIRIEQSDEDVIASLRYSRNIAIRLRAVAELSRRVANGVSILAALYDCARNDGHTAVRRAAASVCAELDTSLVTNRTALKQLFLDLRSDNVSALRALAYNGLRKFRDPEMRDLFMQGMQDSSYHVEAAAMNCLLEADTSGGWEVIKVRLATSSHGDILTLSALDWVDRFPSADALHTVQRLAGPGNSLQVRSKALSTLLRLGISYEAMQTLLVNTLTEARYQFRLLAVSALPVLGKETAHRVARAHRSVEKDPRVLHRIDEMLTGE